MTCAGIVLFGGYSAYRNFYDFIAAFSGSQRYSNPFVEGLQLTMKEAFVNAVKHGNGEQEGLSVSCLLTSAAQSLIASIRDCGKGFDPAAVLYPADSNALLKPSGRGVFIIRSIAEIIALERDREGSSLLLRYIPY